MKKSTSFILTMCLLMFMAVTCNTAKAVDLPVKKDYYELSQLDVPTAQQDAITITRSPQIEFTIINELNEKSINSLFADAAYLIADFQDGGLSSYRYNIVAERNSLLNYKPKPSCKTKVPDRKKELRRSSNPKKAAKQQMANINKKPQRRN